MNAKQFAFRMIISAPLCSMFAAGVAMVLAYIAGVPA